MPDISKILRLIRGHVRGGTMLSDIASWRDPFQVLIATVLSARTKDENTAKVAKKLFAKYGTPQKLSDAPLKEVKKLIFSIGFYNVKAVRIKSIAKEILQRFGGKTPDNMEDLVSLHGVGRKTASCVLVYAFRKPAIPVDVHVNRISNRLGIVKTKTPEQTEAALMKLVPKQNWIEVNELFVKFGQQTCLPRNPKCAGCPLRKRCAYYNSVFLLSHRN